ncbi:MAG: hypothetical protein ACOZNI_22475 [Myxococcota bacterium]
MWPLLMLLAAAPPLAPGETEALARREVVVRVDDGEDGTSLVALVRVAAPPDRVLSACMEVERLANVRGVASIEVYDRSMDRVAARVEIEALGLSRAYHVVHRADRARGRVDYALDPGRRNDVTRLEGSYEVFPDEGGTLLVNRGSGDVRGWVPPRVRRWAATRAVREKLELIRQGAEGSTP